MRGVAGGTQGRTALPAGDLPQAPGRPAPRHTADVIGSARCVSALVVEADPEERRRLGSWLEAEGFDVLECPGPTEPDYTCVWARGGTCALAANADVVVLDMSLDSEAVMLGTAADELLGLYLMAAKSVVVLGSHPGGEVPGQLRRLPRHPGRAALLEAVGGLIAPPRSSEAGTGS